MYLCMNIGCIECGVSSKIVGVFTDKAVAEAYADKLPDTHDWREGGQNHFEVFELPEADKVDPEYISGANHVQP